MSDSTTIARPYAKAIFEHALAEKELPHWSTILQELATAVLDSHATHFISSPASTAELQSELLMSLFAKAHKSAEIPAIENFVLMLAKNKRLLVLPEISAQYEALRAEQEKTITVQVKSFSKLNSAQEQDLINSLAKRLQRQITLDVNIDETLLGGAIISAGDLVIDGSVRGKLNKLGTDLAAF